MKKTDFKGENASNVKLKDAQVLEIRKLRDEGVSLKEIAARFKISVGYTSRLAKRQVWNHI